MTSEPPPQNLPLRHALSEQEALRRLSTRRGIPARAPAKRIASGIQKLTRSYLKEEGPGIDLIRNRWRDLAGDRLSKVSVPVKLAKGKSGLVLHLDIVPAAAPMFQHQAEALRRKISVLMGGEVSALKLNHRVSAHGPERSSTHPPVLTLQDKQALEEATSGVRSPHLKAALMKFVQSALERQNSQQ